MEYRRIITGIKNYNIYELKTILDDYVYNKYDNNYNGILIHNIIDNKTLPGELFKKYPQNINIAYWNFRDYLKILKILLK